jgi:hypothetical protein
MLGFRVVPICEGCCYNVETFLKKQKVIKWKLPKTAKTPMQTLYRLELDVTPELGPNEASYYQSLIGVLRWMVELG